MRRSEQHNQTAPRHLKTRPRLTDGQYYSVLFDLVLLATWLVVIGLSAAFGGTR